MSAGDTALPVNGPQSRWRWYSLERGGGRVYRPIRALQDVITMPLLDVYEHAFDEDVPLSEQTRVGDGDSEEQISPYYGHSADINVEEDRSSP